MAFSERRMNFPVIFMGMTIFHVISWIFFTAHFGPSNAGNRIQERVSTVLEVSVGWVQKS